MGISEFHGTTILDKIVTAVVIGLLSWNVYTTQLLQINQAVMRAQVEEIKASTTVFQSNAVTQAILAQKVDKLDKDYDDLKERYDELRKRIYEPSRQQ